MRHYVITAMLAVSVPAAVSAMGVASAQTDERGHEQVGKQRAVVGGRNLQPKQAEVQERLAQKRRSSRPPITERQTPDPDRR